MKNINKWYNNPIAVDTLLFVLPPLGIYGLYKSVILKNKITKILYGMIGFVSLSLAIFSLVYY
jgi:hypothetical protein